MAERRVIFLFLDGYDAALGERLADAGAMPALRRMRERARAFDLDHGVARWTGLAGEHASSGLAPEAAGRHGAVRFDPETYAVARANASSPPFPALLPARTVVFNPTYFDMARAPAVRGIVGWGGVHDPGAAALARPECLAAEIDTRFGPDPGAPWTYSVVWNSTERTQAMASALSAGLALKARVVRWLLAERLPDWELALLSIGEVHSVLEAMWHGIDPGHPLHGAPSAAPARDGVRAIYGALDELFAILMAEFPQAAFVVASLHGMGPNASDVAGMALLPELLFRFAFGQQRLPALHSEPLLPESGDWSGLMRRLFAAEEAHRPSLLRRIRPRLDLGGGKPVGDPAIDWIPAGWYRPAWRRMNAFALPAFYDGRIRLNLVGRERHGRISPKLHAEACHAVEALIGACRDTRTGAPVASAFERVAPDLAPALGDTAADIVVRWNGAPVGFDHPRLGRIGPFPYKRMGGHTGGHGRAYVLAQSVAGGVAPGLRSAFDVVPTVVDLLGYEKPAGMDGRSLVASPISVPRRSARA